MYAVVGCRDCGAYWVVDGDPQTTSCPRCGTRHRFSKLHRFAETADADAAREARSRLIRERGNAEDAVQDLDSYASMGNRLDDAGVDDVEFLAASGIDPDETAEAGERATAGRERRSRREVVRDGLRVLDDPTETDVVAYAGEHGVPAEYVRRALSQLVAAGDVTETNGRYRLL